MKLFLLLVALLMPIPVFAVDASTMRSIEGYCQTTKDPQQCLTSFLDDARVYEQTKAWEEERNFQLALARESARARATNDTLALMWLFSRPISVPYQIPQALSSDQLLYNVPLQPLPRSPIHCQSYSFGNGVNTTCY